MAKQLSDYSGPFDPKFSQDQLSREALAKLLKAYSDYIRKMDGHWYLSVMQKCGNDIAFECDSEVWEELSAYTIRMTRNLLNIDGNDVETFLKAMQVNPWTLMYKSNIELIDSNHGVITFYDCPTLDALEREGGRRWETICNDLEVRLMDVKAHVINPNIKVTPLKLPPRDPCSDVCCKWGFVLETE